MRWRAVAYRWFVEYNPLYFASALCVLGGVFLFARELPPDDFGSKLGIVGATESYQALLLAGAWLLLRARQRRPAVILGLASVVFLLDAALDGERIFSHVGLMSLASGMRARRALPASLLLALLGPLKVWLLARLFRIRGAGGTLTLAGLASAALPLLPYAIEAAGHGEVLRRSAHLAAFWLGAPLFGWALTRRAGSWSTAWARDARDGEMTYRIATAVPYLVAGLFVAHGVAWSLFPGLVLSAAHGAPYAMAAACVVSSRLAGLGSRWAEPAAWAGSAAALGLSLAGSASGDRWPVAALALMAGASLLALVERTGLRLLLPALVCVFGGTYVFAAGGAPGALPIPGAGWSAALAVALLAAAARHRDARCLTASALAMGGAVLSLDPAAGLGAYGTLVAGLWLAGWSWLLFPALRGWLPFLASLAVLGVGATLLPRDPGALLPWYAAAAATMAGIGYALERREFQLAGLLAFVPIGLVTRTCWVPRTSGGWGLVLLATGFLLLAVGVSFNLLAARRRERPIS